MMTMERALRGLRVGAVLLLICSAAHADVRPNDVIDAPIVANISPLSLEDVGKAVVRAGAGLGWKVVPAGPGAMTGTLVLRTHTAVVDIVFDTKTYSIRYKDSVNLNYDGKTIHRAYNGWIHNLNKAIGLQLGLL